MLEQHIHAGLVERARQHADVTGRKIGIPRARDQGIVYVKCQRIADAIRAQVIDRTRSNGFRELHLGLPEQ